MQHLPHTLSCTCSTRPSGSSQRVAHAALARAPHPRRAARPPLRALTRLVTASTCPVAHAAPVTHLGSYMRSSSPDSSQRAPAQAHMQHPSQRVAHVTLARPPLSVRARYPQTPLPPLRAHRTWTHMSPPVAHAALARAPHPRRTPAPYATKPVSPPCQSIEPVRRPPPTPRSP